MGDLPIARIFAAVIAAALGVIFAVGPGISPARAQGAALDRSFAAWREALAVEAQAPPFAVSKATFDRAFAGVTPDLSLPDLVLPGRPASSARGQAEFIKPPQAYLDRAYLERLAAQGRGLAVQHAATLERIEAEIGVERQVVLAIWGRETAFGAHKLPHATIRVLATQAFLGRRKDLFRQELLYALKMLEERVVGLDDMRSSWAGAMGLTQFMPSEFFKSARSLGGGKPDLFRSVPDALASAAEQLRQKGWVKGLPWGFEVIVPSGADCAFEGPLQARPLSEWARLGFRRTRGRPWPKDFQGTEAYLMAPGGAHGPAFLVTENYKVIRRYNMSDLYATFVGHLADRIAGGGDFDTPWRDIRQIPETQVATIQERLKSRGFEIDKIDGKVGSNTRMLIGTYQRQSGLTVDCWPSDALADHLVKVRSR